MPSRPCGWQDSSIDVDAVALEVAPRVDSDPPTNGGRVRDVFGERDLALSRRERATVRRLAHRMGSGRSAYQLLLTQAVSPVALWQLRATVPLAARMML